MNADLRSPPPPTSRSPRWRNGLDTPDHDVAVLPVEHGGAMPHHRRSSRPAAAVLDDRRAAVATLAGVAALGTNLLGDDEPLRSDNTVVTVPAETTATAPATTTPKEQPKATLSAASRSASAASGRWTWA